MDLGYIAKVRPCLVLNIALEDEDRALITLIPHTTSRRGSRFEVDISLRFLKDGAFDVQQITSYSIAKALKNLGKLTSVQLSLVEDALRFWLGL